ncbi:DUF602-domain-containing protein [Tilletiaria anomala UBC 951]|uniref:DUF602-domain-containing protein n=1 Tax=Tilletiaria anomala (strain ATCC 24038 / CBS 436.72 / UBC 951) TaxID=1037660 RepID=A0A066VVH6_TILAU|nr:DUF602-domain-containing protein [Tilletiaria anomala UBC 951]KDN45481.1 DUF602-domain-containing protein [Tilletiaria anomala UBC 951]
MGNDGGSIPKRDDLVKVKAALSTLPPSLLAKALWTTCALSRRPFREPVVADALGHIFNKESVVQYLLTRSERGKESAKVVALEEDIVAGHLRGLKDVVQLRLRRNPAHQQEAASGADVTSLDSATYPFLCPLTGKELSGKYRCVYLRACGCAFVESGLRAICAESSESTRTDAMRQCPNCATDFRAGSSLSKGKPLDVAEGDSDVLLLNPGEKEREKMREHVAAARQAEMAAKKLKNASSNDERRQKAEPEEDAEAITAKRKRKAEKKALREEQIKALQAELAAQEEGPTLLHPAVKRQKTDGAGLTAARVAGQAKQAAQAKAITPAIASVYGRGPKKPLH